VLHLSDSLNHPLKCQESLERVDFPAAMPYTDIMEPFDLACVDEVVAFTDLAAGPMESPWGAQEALQAFADDFPLYSHWYPVAPDLQIQASQIDLDAAGPAWICPSTVRGLAAEPSRSAPFAACEARVRTLLTILELDSRPSFWEDPGEAHKQVDRALSMATVAVGNRGECEVPVDDSDPDRNADTLLDKGIELAIVKKCAKGVLARTRDQGVEVEPARVEVVNALGADEALGGPPCHGLSAARLLEAVLMFVSCCRVIVASRRERSTAMPTDHEVNSAWVNGGQPIMGPWPLSTWPPNWCMEVRHE
jgi:hypothetical protein